MDAQPPREQSVPVGVVDHVIGGGPAHGEGPGHHVGPQVYVRAGVRHHRRFAGGAAGCVDPHDVSQGDGQQAEGVVIAEVGLGGEGQLRQVVEGANVVGRHLPLLEGPR